MDFQIYSNVKSVEIIMGNEMTEQICKRCGMNLDDPEHEVSLDGTDSCMDSNIGRK